MAKKAKKEAKADVESRPGNYVSDIAPLCRYISAYLLGCAICEATSDKRKVLYKMAGELDMGLVHLGYESILPVEDKESLKPAAEKAIGKLPKEISLRCPHCKREMLKD